jgi:hypothetical protein
MRKIKLTKLIYPSITIFFAVVVLFLFTRTISFLSENINKAFTENNPSLQEQVPQFDKINYELIKRRFGWKDQAAASSSASIITAASSSPAIQAPLKASSSLPLKK